MRTPKRRSKIVCTLGPAVSTVEKLMDLIEAGMDVARINMSHGSYEAHNELISNVRAASKKLEIPVGILMDLQGPKIRTGKLVSKIMLTEGQTIFFRGIDPTAKQTLADGSKENPVEITFPRLARDLKAGDLLLIEDGLLRMKVVRTWPDDSLLEATVLSGKSLGEKKGVNFPDAKLSALGVTEKDWADILFGLEQDVDFFALSFVRSAKEVRYLKSFLQEQGKNIHVIAKIEKAEAVKELEEIVFHSDGVMVARGDLGVEIGNEAVPLIQKHIIRVAQKHAKPVITATQMLLSMVDNPTPTRAEASDVANAVIDGSDALMLSNETSVGEYPIDTVKMMDKIIVGAEDYKPTHPRVVEVLKHFETKRTAVSEAIEAAATVLATSLNAKVIACLTRSGSSARLLSKNRPSMPIIAFAENPKVRAQLCLSWGVSVVPWKEMPQQDYTIFDELLEELDRIGLMKISEVAILTAGIPTTRRIGTTNTVVVRHLERHVDERIKNR
ncbi:pyruvate kinase [bacterium]|nr:pyruvate kinase [bacterium]